ncbi:MULTISPECIES: DNA polymerase I [unclassified Undibacterium]|uniref:DNA polymerase I n=1 Tax=unclassified Undibacterium TaxID=2630295 RepID=UPI002AC9D1EF|nr:MULTISPECIES: DNA polymerase I [unclassified Undibacterium]MEB0140439.1 DNA polymerase I [Undibacterium sp. CCC2.1]MEB0173552.1 DNA polymerase I [Undibacterium sp. CCC1.1]MEB0177478.1 DNA polymerase I [Undibacterium sp. CCC3.4]MEB0214332.1 DNA polymerase I [Undibacterium sp. 5I2]WPX44203.1 DNA polymerase I [Undibacterium sp. CCC3.4]
MQNTLLLVDGSSYLYRAFHAMPDLRNPQGEPTGAIYGMINMLRRLRSDYPAAYMACVFDAKGKTFRDDLYPEYKAQRAPMPDDLRLQIEPIHAAVTAMGWPILMVEGVEADDVIGTLCVAASELGMKTVVSTGDKDLAQLVNANVTLINTMSNETLDEAAVLSKFGVPPNRIIDYLSLIGDTVDNVPGVSKCGPKTAVKWLAEYDSLEGVIAHASAIKGVVGDHLRAALEWLPQARALITVKTDCDLSAHYASIPASLTAQPESKEAMLAFFSRYGFKSWLRELSGDATAGATPLNPAAAGNTPVQAGLFAEAAAGATLPTAIKNYETILTEAALDAWIVRIRAAKLTAVDTETTSLEPMTAQLVGISLCCEVGHAAYIPVAHQYADAPTQLSRALVLEKLRPWLEDAGAAKLGQNLKYDSHIFANHGILLRGIAHDTLLQSYVFESHKAHDMDSLALRHLGKKTISFAEVCGKGAAQICFDQVEIGRATEYAAEDADITLQLHLAMWPEIEPDPKLLRVYRTIELPTSVVLQKIERNGVLISKELLATQSNELGKRLLELEQRAYELAEQPFNLNSPKQLGEIFFGKLGLPVVKKTPSGAPSTDEEVLQKLAEDYPLPKVLLEYRGLAKLKSTYTDKLPKMLNLATGRVHTNYAQAVAVTGRLASNDPNLQNIPVRSAEGRRIREAFIAAPGHVLVSADYSQIELRIMAHISGDASLLAAFANGEDIHRATAAEIFGVALAEVSSEQRRYAKVINFGLIYGMSAFGLAGNLGIERAAAQSYIDKYFQRYPGVAQYMADTRVKAKAHGYVETVFGRRLWLAEINSANGPRRQGAERAAINAPMQGTAADLIKLAMIAVQDWLERDGLHSKMIMQVHDELVLEVPQAELELVQRKLPELMAGAASLDVPLLAEVGVGNNWEEAH